jgi:CubicO group peptidase (beta-lactamase class C family)
VTTALEDLLARQVDAGTIQGALALLGRGDDVEVAAIGVASDDGRPMPADAIMRIQSMTKVITSVAALRLVESGRLRLDQSVEEWLPELANRRVLIGPTAPLENTVPARRAITFRHLLTNASGYGMVMTDSPLQRAMARKRDGGRSRAADAGCRRMARPAGRAPARLPPRRGMALPPLLRSARHPARPADRPAPR